MGYYMDDSILGCIYMYLLELHSIHVLYGIITLVYSSNTIIYYIVIFPIYIISMDMYCIIEYCYYHIIEYIYLHLCVCTVL